MSPLSRTESATLEAVLSRLIPCDEYGPGAVEAGVGRYVQEALAAQEHGAARVRSGLRTLDEQSSGRFGSHFVEIEAEQQDELLASIAGSGEDQGTEFFETLRGYALQGMFGDPSYGGNVDSCGWALIGYQGVRTAIESEAQELLELLPAPSQPGTALSTANSDDDG